MLVLVLKYLAFVKPSNFAYFSKCKGVLTEAKSCLFNLELVLNYIKPCGSSYQSNLDMVVSTYFDQ